MSIETPAAPPSLAAPSTIADTAVDTSLDTAVEQDPEFAEDSLVEEVSIDGMCGVY